MPLYFQPTHRRHLMLWLHFSYSSLSHDASFSSVMPSSEEQDSYGRLPLVLCDVCGCNRVICFWGFFLFVFLAAAIS